ncbi:MAG: hypothetical protein ACTTJS_02460 [Wolinella sp.]
MRMRWQKSLLVQAEENYRIASERYKEHIEKVSELLDAELLPKKARVTLIGRWYAIAETIVTFKRIIEE